MACPLAFRFSSIERLPERPSVAATRGSLVHRALELFYRHVPAERSATALDRSVEQAIVDYSSDPDFTELHLDAAATKQFHHECRVLASRYLQLEDPTSINAIGLELKLEAKVGNLTLRGIIDRLDLDLDGRLIVTDYKTGRAPSPNWERKSMSGVHFYAFLCEQVFGVLPGAIRLMYLKSGETITATPSSQSTKFIMTRTSAVMNAVERACSRDDFRPKSGPLCNYCSFRQWCPEYGGDPSLAAIEAPLAVGAKPVA